MSKYYIVKAFASDSQIEEGKAFAEAAGYSVDLSGDSPNFTIDTDLKIIFMNGSTGERLYSLDAFKKVIDENPVEALDEVRTSVEDFDTVLEAFDDEDVDTEVNGAKTIIEDGDFMVATSSTDVEIEKNSYTLKVVIK